MHHFFEPQFTPAHPPPKWVQWLGNLSMVLAIFWILCLITGMGWMCLNSMERLG